MTTYLGVAHQHVVSWDAHMVESEVAIVICTIPKLWSDVSKLNP